MKTDRETEDKQNMIEREIHSTAASESSLCSSEESTFFYSSLPSISGSVSIQMTESATMSEKESANNTDTEWDAADKEYMDINSDVGSNANLDFAIGYIDQEEPFVIGIFENQNQFKEDLTNLSKVYIFLQWFLKSQNLFNFSLQF